MTDSSPMNIKILSRLGASGAISQASIDIVRNDQNTVFLTADTCSFSGLSRLKDKFPENIINVGISEQNLIGIAAGLANEGFNIYATTYASFLTLRSADQIKVCLSYMNLPVKLMGLASGLSAGILGPTHMSIEDIAFMRALPNITIISPADCLSVVKAIEAVHNLNSPVYIRLSAIQNCPIVYKEDFVFEIGKAIELRSGMDLCIVATGSMVATALKVADKLALENISVSVIDMHTIKPLDTVILDKYCNCKLMVSVEEHSVIGGLGSSIAEYYSQKSKKPRLIIEGIRDFYPKAGDYNYLISECNLSSDILFENIYKHYKEI